MWWNKHKYKFIAAVAVIAVLAAAFLYGGKAPSPSGYDADSGLTADPSDAVTSSADMPKETDDSAETDTPRPTDESVTSDLPEQTPDAADTPDSSSTPEETEPAGETDIIPDTSPDTEATPEPTPSEQPTDTPAPDTAASESVKDKYQTEEVPEGKPVPVEPEEATVGTDTYTCTMSISCATILDNMELLDKDKHTLVSEDGWILEPVTVTFYEGESVFNVLQRVCKQNKIHMEFVNTPIYNSAYIEGINNLYEFDVGELSGWMYKVNDWFPNYGCSRYQLAADDVICWVYTCDLGSDVGGRYASGE